MRWLRNYDAGYKPDILGLNVYGADDEKLGKVDDVIFDDASGDIRYLVVEAGWLNTRHFIVPADQVFARGDKDDDVFVNVTKPEINRLPEFSADHLRSEEDFARYERAYGTAWRYDADRAKVRPSSRLERFRKSWRTRFADFKARRIQPLPVSEAERVPPVSASSQPAAYSDRGSAVVPHATGVYGMYRDRPDLERAIDGLKDIGFRNTDISVLFPDTDKTRQFAVEHSTKAPEGALAGGGTGLVVGGALGWLAGIGALAIPGIGPFIAAGPIVSAIAGAGIGSAIGGIAGALIGLGVPEYEAKRYESELKKGGILLSVHCEDARFGETARKVLERTGAKDVFLAEEKRAA